MIKLEKIGKVIDYIRNDLNKHYGLKSEVSVRLQGEGVNDLFGKQERMVCGNHLTIYSDPITTSVTLTAHPFTIKDELWNGPNIIPNDDYESMLASLFHDLLYVNLFFLSCKLDCSESEIRKWADKVLYAILSGASRSKLERFKARLGYGVCRAFGGIFTSLTKWFMFLIAILTITGCCVPDWNLEDVQGEEAVKEVIKDGNK